MKRKMLFGLLVVTLVSLVALPFLSACAEPEVIELTFTTVMPPQAPMTQVFTTWADRVMAESGGRVNITCYLGGSLMKHEEEFRGVQEGVADIAWYSPSEDPGNWELNEFQNLCFLPFKSNRQGTIIYNEMLDNKDTGLWDEYEERGLRPYGAQFPPPFQLLTVDKPVRVPADMAGMKCYALGDVAKVVSAAGGAPVEIVITDLYMALDRGMVEGFITHLAAALVFGLMEFPNYVTLFGPGGCYEFLCLFIINADTWDSFPTDIKQIFINQENFLIEEGAVASNFEVEAAFGVCQERGVTILELTPQEIAAWAELAKPAHDEWMARMEGVGKGEEARVLWDELQRLTAAYPE